jgi:hypothetical protein
MCCIRDIQSQSLARLDNWSGQNKTMKTKLIPLGVAALLVGICWSAAAQNTVVTYQGRITDNGTNFSGTGQFKFALGTSTNNHHTATAQSAGNGNAITFISVVNGGNGYVTPPTVTITGGGGSGAMATASISGGVVTSITINTPGSGYVATATVTISPPPENITRVTYWSNDGTSSVGSEPLSAVSAPVANGLFTVGLGDTSLANMTALSASLFQQTNLQLRIWFNDGVYGFAALSPEQNLTTAPYAHYAYAAGALTVASNQPISLSINGTTLLSIALGYDGSLFGGYTANVRGGSPDNIISNGVLGGFIGGGGNTFSPNRVGGNYASVLGGLGNTASGYAATAMGFNCTASGTLSLAIGDNATANGNDSMAIGSYATANGFASTAMGHLATASQAGAFVWADSTPVGFDPWAMSGPQGVPDSFNVRSTGGFFIASGVNPSSGQITSGVQLSAGSGTWASYSDRNAKTNFATVNTRAVLEKLVQIPVATWNYKAQADSIRHIGPMGQDFAAAFGVGEDDTHITTVDADGVALAAIQGLNQKLEEQRTENAALKQELAGLKEMIERLAQSQKDR